MNKVFLAKAFSSDPSLGNLAGVVLDEAGGLSDATMQNIAHVVGAAESAFLSPSSAGADVKLRWFTPNSEVGMCVHASVASIGLLHLLAKQGEPTFVIPKPLMKVETMNSVLDVLVDEHKVMVNVQGYEIIDEEISSEILIKHLGLQSTTLLKSAKIVQIYSDREMVIEVPKLEDLARLSPSMEEYSLFCQELNVSGFSIFCRETYDNKCDIHTRQFAPLYGYLEDPLCGTAAGAIFYYLGLHNKDSSLLRVEQGHFAGTSGIIEVESAQKGVWIGGLYSLAGSTEI